MSAHKTRRRRFYTRVTRIWWRLMCFSCSIRSERCTVHRTVGPSPTQPEASLNATTPPNRSPQLVFDPLSARCKVSHTLVITIENHSFANNKFNLSHFEIQANNDPNSWIIKPRAQDHRNALCFDNLIPFETLWRPILISKCCWLQNGWSKAMTTWDVNWKALINSAFLRSRRLDRSPSEAFKSLFMALAISKIDVRSTFPLLAGYKTVLQQPMRSSIMIPTRKFEFEFLNVLISFFWLAEMWSD